jgi:hypothetical protein
MKRTKILKYEMLSISTPKQMGQERRMEKVQLSNKFSHYSPGLQQIRLQLQVRKADVDALKPIKRGDTPMRTEKHSNFQMVVRFEIACFPVYGCTFVI